MATVEVLRVPPGGDSERQLATDVRVSVVIPCLNEAENIERCVELAYAVLDEHELPGEVIVVDNGSDDESGVLARAAGATVIYEPRRGYGSAYLAGFNAARGDYIVMIDADLTYDFHDIPRFVEELDDGAELVMGNRMDGIEPGAMPLLNRYVGNPLLSGFLNLLFRTNVRDVHCGMRAFRRDVLPRLDLHATGMELASEMVIRAAKERLDVREFPIELHRRGGISKLSPFRDGWRHLRLILVYCPTFLFLLPGVLMVALGGLITLTVLAHLSVFGRPWFVHALIGGCLLVIVGMQVTGLGLCGRAFGVHIMGERDPWFQRMEARFKLEHGLVAGAALTLAGAVLGAVIVGNWASRGFGTLADEQLAVLAATFAIAGIQVFFTSFLLSMLGLRRRG
jgi:glycosyltransferase involved in cell wall biosynthesis